MCAVRGRKYQGEFKCQKATQTDNANKQVVDWNRKHLFPHLPTLYVASDWAAGKQCADSGWSAIGVFTGTPRRLFVAGPRIPKRDKQASKQAPTHTQ